jgi:hypothetical protein
MEYYAGKELVSRLSRGLETGQAAQFTKKEEEHILNLIRNDMVRPSAFVAQSKIRYGAQNLAEKSPITARGRQLYGLPAVTLG